ncbi:hypothetical protein ACHAXM_000034, partial [Skeletonema potamos]
MDPPEAVGLYRPSGRSSRKAAPPPSPAPSGAAAVKSFRHTRTKTTTVLAFCALVILLIFQYYESSTNLSPIMRNNNTVAVKPVIGSEEEVVGGALVEAQIQTSSQPQSVHFRTYGDDNYNWTKARIVQEALDTGWFASVKALGPDDLTADFKKKFEDILKLPRGGGYWIWKYDVIEQALESMNEGDFLVYLDAGSGVNKGGEKRFREYLKMVNESQYDMLCFELPMAEYKWTTQRTFRAFNVSQEDRDIPIRNTGQIEGGTLLMQKGPHLR